jgi:hypothetical protein
MFLGCAISWEAVYLQKKATRVGATRNKITHSPIFRYKINLVDDLFLFRRLDVGTALGNVPLLSTIVTSLVARGLGTVRRDMTHLTTVETTPILSSCLVDHRAIFTFQSRILTISCNVTTLDNVRCMERKQ